MATDRLDRVPRERVNRSADLIDLTRGLAARGAIPVTLPDYMTGGQRDLAPDQSGRNRMPLSWYVSRLATYRGRPIEWDCLGLWVLIGALGLVELYGLWILAGAVVEFAKGVLR